MRIIGQYSPYLCTISQLSWDRERKVSLIADDERTHRMYNFDGIKKLICKELRGNENSSCDALWEKEGLRYLIEFKNQSEGNIDRAVICNKAYDSATLLLVNENLTREQLTENTVFIVVYNNANHKIDDSSYNPSESMDKLTQKLKGFAKCSGLDQKQKKFGIGKYTGHLYKQVYTLDVDEFRQFFYPVLFNT